MWEAGQVIQERYQLRKKIWQKYRKTNLASSGFGIKNLRTRYS